MPNAAVLAMVPSTSVVGYSRAARTSGSVGTERPHNVPSVSTSPSSPAKSFAQTLHAVQSGETLSSVVRDFLSTRGSEPSATEIHDGVQKVAAANHLRNPNAIQVQQNIDLSSLAPPAVSAPAPSTPVSSPVSVAKSLAETTPSTTAPLSVSALRNQLSTEAIPAEPAKSRLSDTQTASVQSLRNPRRNASPPRERIDLSELVRRILHPSEYRAEEAAAASAQTSTPKSVEKSAAEPWQAMLDNSATLSSGYGMRSDPFTGRPTFHDGIDLAAPTGTPIRPVSAGTVTFSGWKAGYGRTVVVRHADGTESSYSHASSTCVSVGDQVTENTMVARVGSTGRSTGPHMHFQVTKDGKTVDPNEILQATNMRLARR